MQILSVLTVSLNLGVLLAAPAILPRDAFDSHSHSLEIPIGHKWSSPLVRPASDANANIHPTALVTDQVSTNRRGWSHEDSPEISEAFRRLSKRTYESPVDKLKRVEARIAKELSSDH